MVEVMMERAPSSSETVDYQMLGKQSPYQAFLAELAKVEQVYAKKHLPFDSACAKQDFKDRMETIAKESERNVGYVREHDARSVKLDLEVYGKADRFDVLDEDEDLQDKVIEGMRTQVQIGWTIKYKCKNRGHGVSVFMPNEVYQERFKGKKKAVKED